MLSSTPSLFHGPHHTVLSVYLVGICSAFSVTYDSTQGIVQRYHINKKWYFLFGATCLFAYLYVRPLIRKRLGSASRIYINWGSVYIAWLCSAVFYHLPSLESMGLDVKADISIILTTFLISLVVLGLLQAIYGLAVLFKAIDPWLHSSSGTAKEAWLVVLLNSATLAVACSTYYSFCGNAATGKLVETSGESIRELVCSKWLYPVTTTQHPAFSSWVLYGEPIGAAAHNLTVDHVHGAGNNWTRNATASASTSPSGNAISPVFTMWLTLVMMFIVNCLADYQVAAAIASASSNAQKINEMRKAKALARRTLRRRSADYAHELGRLNVSTQPRTSMEAIFSAVCDTLPEHIRSPTTGAIRAASTRLMSWRDDSLIGLAALAREYTGGWSSSNAEPKLIIPPDSPQPSFLPMFPWYSGTSADLLKTLFDLLISVKLFLGRFDMRTMQVATSSGPEAVPQDGDGFTYEHLAHKEELWFDFCADTGDGGDPTYAIARCMAAQEIQVTLPENMTGEKDSGEIHKVLPRAQLLVHGGDLAYPNPTDETYEQRLFKPYEAALPPPSHVHPGHLVVNKPDLPPQYWAGSSTSTDGKCCKCFAEESDVVPGSEQKLCRMCRKAETLRLYEGPSCFMIPGNHDWIDGLETFQRHIQHKGWFGGWLLPQEKSYFALHLPHGWWLFGMDLALVDDIDMCQYRYFASIAEERMGPCDQAILVMHCPTWLMDWFWGSQKCRNLRQLIRGPLKGRARMKLAGDLHFFMRHSFQPYSMNPVSPSLAPSLAPSELSTPQGSSPQGMSPTGSMSPTMAPSLRSYMSPSQLHQTLMARLNGTASQQISNGAGNGVSNASRLAPLQKQSGWPTTTQGLGGQQSPSRQGSLSGQHQLPPSSPFLAVQQQQQQQQLVFGRSLDMEYVSSAGSPSGGSPLGGSPTLPSMLLSQEEEEPLPQIRSKRRFAAVAELAAHAIGYPHAGANGLRAANDALPSPSVDGEGSPPTTPTVGSRMGPGFGGRISSAALPVRAGRKSDTLPILSPVHGSQIELASLEDCIHEGPLFAPSIALQSASSLPVGATSSKKIEARFHRNSHGATGADTVLQDLGGINSSLSTVSGSINSTGAITGSESVAGESNAAGAAVLGGSPSVKSGMLAGLSPVRESPCSSVAGSVSSVSGLSSWWSRCKGNGRPGDEGQKQGSNLDRKGFSKLERDESTALGAEGSDGWHLNDPEHLVVCGSGGAFLHPTHVFSYSRFRPVHDSAAGSVFLQHAKGKQSSALRGRIASSSSLYSLYQKGEDELPVAPEVAGYGGGAGAPVGPLKPLGGEYRCTSAFPEPDMSLQLGQRNLHTFRMTNNRFDIIGGALYFLLVISVLPRCSGIAEILNASNVGEGVSLFIHACWSTVISILLESYVSLIALCLLWFICFGFARSGGIGALDGIAPNLRRRPEYQGSSMAVRARIGGLGTQLLFSTAHCLAHLTAAVGLLLLLELGIETVMRYERVGREGYHSLFQWYRRFEAQHFPDPVGLRTVLERWTLGLYPNGIKWLMAAFDVPEAICVSRTAVCAAGGQLSRLTRIQSAGFYFGVLLYYWLLATPTVGFLFGCYLYLCVNVFHVHYDEAFSSLQVPDFKAFCRLHITKNGDLEMYSLGLDKVPSNWREDPRWRTPQGGGSRGTPSHKAKYPSRWLPVKQDKLLHNGGGLKVASTPEASLKVVDFLMVPKYKQ